MENTAQEYIWLVFASYGSDGSYPVGAFASEDIADRMIARLQEQGATYWRCNGFRKLKMRMTTDAHGVPGVD